MKNKIVVKTKSELDVMIEGGKKLARIKKKLFEAVDVGVRASEIEDLACNLIEKSGGKASFKMVDNYDWATCVNVNDGVVHGIPKKSLVFKDGDLMSVDVGLFYKGFHTDTSFSKVVGKQDELRDFVEAGKKALEAAISKAKPGNKVYDISESIENSLKKNSVTPVRALVGHGIGKELHEQPQIHCFVNGEREKSPVIPEGAVFAIEVMYTQGGYDVELSDDKWTIRTCDGTISALFEDTVAILKEGPKVLT